MIERSPKLLAKELVDALVPEGSRCGLDACLCQAILEDVLARPPFPHTVEQLVRALEREPPHRLASAVLLLEALRERAGHEPNRLVRSLID